MMTADSQYELQLLHYPIYQANSLSVTWSLMKQAKPLKMQVLWRYVLPLEGSFLSYHIISTSSYTCSKGQQVEHEITKEKNVKLKNDSLLPFIRFPFYFYVPNVCLFSWFLVYTVLTFIDSYARSKIIEICYCPLEILKSMCNISNIWILSRIYSSCLIFSWFFSSVYLVIFYFIWNICIKRSQRLWMKMLFSHSIPCQAATAGRESLKPFRDWDNLSQVSDFVRLILPLIWA